MRGEQVNSVVLFLRLLIRQVERTLLSATGKADAGAGDDQQQPQESGRQSIFHGMLHKKHASIRRACNKPNAGVQTEAY
jgi:hypothetical protein